MTKPIVIFFYKIWFRSSLQKFLLSKHEFYENQHCDSCTLLKGINEFLPVLSVLFHDRFGLNLVYEDVMLLCKVLMVV